MLLFGMSSVALADYTCFSHVNGRTFWVSDWYRSDALNEVVQRCRSAGYDYNSCGANVSCRDNGTYGHPHRYPYPYPRPGYPHYPHPYPGHPNYPGNPGHGDHDGHPGGGHPGGGHPGGGHPGGGHPGGGHPGGGHPGGGHHLDETLSDQNLAE